mgnify:CR=1 FL=1
MQTAALAMSKGMAFSVYGENLIILVQNAAIILLIWQFNKDINIIVKILVLLFWIGYAYILFTPNFLGNNEWTLISSSSTLLNIIAKLPQIYSNFTAKSTGQMAFFTFFLNFAGAIARLGTVLFESDDFYFRLQYIVGVLLNAMIVLQFALYWNSGPAKVVPVSKTQTKREKNKME